MNLVAILLYILTIAIYTKSVIIFHLQESLYRRNTYKYYSPSLHEMNSSSTNWLYLTFTLCLQYLIRLCTTRAPSLVSSASCLCDTPNAIADTPKHTGPYPCLYRNREPDQTRTYAKIINE